jgi:general secretion pathway protein D
MRRLLLLSIITMPLFAASRGEAQSAQPPTNPPPIAGPRGRPGGPGGFRPGSELLRQSGAAAPGGQTGGTTTPAPTPAPAPAPAGGNTGTGGGTSGTTGGGAAGTSGGATTPGTGAAGATGGGTSPATTPGGKALGDTQKLQQFEQSMDFEPRSPNYKVSFSLEDADLAELVRVIGQLTGKRFIFGGKVKSIKATVYSPEKVTVAEAYQAFLSILEANGLTVVPHGRFLKIIETSGVSTQGTPMYAPGQKEPNEERYVTRIHRMSHVGADEAANVLGKFKSKDADITVYGPGNLLIMTDTGSNIKRMIGLLDEIDVGGAGDQMFIEPVHYASASDIANRVNELFELKGGGTAAPNPKGGAPVTTAAAGGDLHVAKVVADDRSNSLVIVSTERAYLRILELIKRLDVPQTGEGEIHVLPLQHADATELTKTLNDIITGANQAGAPAAGGAKPAGGGAPPSGIFEGGIKVSADKATNSIVVTSSLRDYASLRAVIDKLDQPRRQVFIEAVIMDLQLKRSNSLGVSFHGGDTFSGGSQGDGLIYGGNKVLNTILPLPSDPDALQGFALGVRGPGISGTQSFLGTGISIPAFGTFVQALAQTGDSDLLSTPHVLALDNEDAEINVGDNIPLQTNATPILAGLGGIPGATGAAGAAGLAGIGGAGLGGFGSPRQDVGTKVKIKPHLNDSNQVRLDVTEEISEQGAPLGGTLGAIPISKRTATTKLVVEDQQTVVIGGLIRNVLSRAEDKIPVLGDIPVLGALFRKRTDKVEKRNLVLILTPYIIREQADLRNVFERKMQERQEYLDRYFVFSDMNEYTPPRDYSRTNGLVEEIRQAFFGVEEKKKLDELTRPKELRGHDPQRPLEMPAGQRPPGAAAPGTGPAATPTPGTGGQPPVQLTPQIRNVEK